MTSSFAERVEALFGDPMIEPVGVQHVAAAVADGDDRLALLRIANETPRSAVDRFLLELSRARVDAIVTTGRILRDEPQLRPELSMEAAEWRRTHLGKLRPPSIAILTTGRDVSPQHPIFSLEAEAVLLTGQPGAERLASLRFARRPQIVALEAPSLRAAIEWLKQRGDSAISIEAGASTSADLYAEPLVVDELLLSIFDGPLGDSLRAAPLPSLATLQSRLTRVDLAPEVLEKEGVWRFYRMRRGQPA